MPLNLDSSEALEKEKLKNDKTSNYYKPNFVVVPKSPKILKVLSDIVPSRNNQNKDVVIISWKGLQKFVSSSKVVAIIVSALITRTVNNTAYKGYTVASSSYKAINLFPSKSRKKIKKTKEYFKSLKDKRVRRLFFIEKRLKIRIAFKAYLEKFKNVYLFFVKMYLLIFVSLSLIVLSIIGLTSSGSIVNTLIVDSTVERQERVGTLSESQAIDFSVTFLENIKEKKSILSHTVKEGETVEMLSNLFSVKPETIRYNNSIKGNLNSGVKLYIPWVDGYIYTAEKNISPQELSETYKVPKEDIIGINGSNYNRDKQFFPKESLVIIPIDNYDIIDKIIADREKKERDEKEAKANAIARETRRRSLLASRAVNSGCGVSKSSQYKFIWPVRGKITQCYGRTSFSHNYSNNSHSGLDIDADYGNIISAAKGGTVTISGWSRYGYGRHIVIDHGNGLTTLYGHMSSLSVRKGQKVVVGQKIGGAGSTGFSTGVHLHLEVKVNGKVVNPLQYLP